MVKALKNNTEEESNQECS